MNYILYIPTTITDDVYKFDRIIDHDTNAFSFTTKLENAGELYSEDFDDVLGRGTAEEVFKYYEAAIIEADGVREKLKTDDPELVLKLMNGARIVDLVYLTSDNDESKVGTHTNENQGKSYSKENDNTEQALTQYEADLLAPAMHDAEQFILSLDFDTDTEKIHALQKIMPGVDLKLLQEHLQLMSTLESEVYSHIQIAE